MQITHSINQELPCDGAETLENTSGTGILILGKNRNFLKNEIVKQINVFDNKIFCADSVSGADFFGLSSLLTVCTDPSQHANALKAAISAGIGGTQVYIFTSSPFAAAKNFADAVIYTREDLLIAAVCGLTNILNLNNPVSLSGENFYIGFAAEDPIDAICGAAAGITDGMKNAAVYFTTPGDADFLPYKDLLARVFYGFHSCYTVTSADENTDCYRADIFLKT